MQPFSLHPTEATPRPGAHRAGEGSEDQRVDWPAVASAFVHPLKLAILQELAHSKKPESAVGLARTFEKREQRQWYLSIVSHHLKTLEKAGLAVPVKRRPVRGAIETFYVLAEKR